MTEWLIGFGLRPVIGVNLLILLFVVWIFIRVVANENNAIIWADFVSSLGTDGKQHGDLKKLGQLAGIVVAVVSALMYADAKNVEATGLAALLAVVLLYLGGVTDYVTTWLKLRGNGSSPPPSSPQVLTATAGSAEKSATVSVTTP
jgi:hypothetical protein